MCSDTDYQKKPNGLTLTDETVHANGPRQRRLRASPSATRADSVPGVEDYTPTSTYDVDRWEEKEKTVSLYI